MNGVGLHGRAAGSSGSPPAGSLALFAGDKIAMTSNLTDQLGRRDLAFGKGAPLFYDTPIKLARGEGAYLFDESGRRYLDLYNNVPCVGHCHPHVVEAVARQAETLNVHSRYLHDSAIEFAERLAALHGPQIESVLFSCSGTEANESALRMARFATGRTGFLCSNWTYHGNSDLVSSLTFVGTARPETDTVRAFPFPELYRALKPGLGEDQLCEAYLEKLQAGIDHLQRTGAGLAALIVCSIFANEGLPNIPREFMARASELVRRAGGLVIADEVQAGYARTGEWWGYQQTGFTPDIVVTGKPMGNGIPLAATATSRDILGLFRSKTRYFNTFASSPLQAAAGMAVLDVIEAEGLLENATKVGAEFKRRLVALTANTPFVGEVRGRGLFIAVEIVEPGGDKTPDQPLAAKIANRLKDLGALTANAGAFGNIVKLRPPLAFRDHHLEEFLQIWSAAMDGLDA